MIIHDTIHHRFELTEQGHLAFVSYTLVPGGLDLNHTFVPPFLEGQGIGARLVRHALDYAQENQLRIIPTCSFVRRYMERHPEYDGLLFH